MAITYSPTVYYYLCNYRIPSSIGVLYGLSTLLFSVYSQYHWIRFVSRSFFFVIYLFSNQVKTFLYWNFFKIPNIVIHLSKRSAFKDVKLDVPCVLLTPKGLIIPSQPQRNFEIYNFLIFLADVIHGRLP